jgi:hypothetical protein
MGDPIEHYGSLTEDAGFSLMREKKGIYPFAHLDEDLSIDGFLGLVHTPDFQQKSAQRIVGSPGLTEGSGEAKEKILEISGSGTPRNVFTSGSKGEKAAGWAGW